MVYAMIVSHYFFETPAFISDAGVFVMILIALIYIYIFFIVVI